MSRARVIGAGLLCVLLGRAANAQCLQVVDDAAPPSVGAPEVDVRQVLRLPSGQRNKIKANYVYVAVTRESGNEPVDGRSLERESETFLRLLDGPRREAPFTFSRQGPHTLRVYGTDKLPWPEPASTVTMTLLCGPQPVTVHPKLLREDFPGVRAQWWGGYRIPLSVELGGSVFIRRIGIATSTEVAIRRALRATDDPARINPVVGAIEVRYRGARGYIGGGVRYYPDKEPDREQWRPVVTFADELPSFKGRPLWLLVDIRVEHYEKNFLKGVRPSFGVRFDLWGSRP